MEGALNKENFGRALVVAREIKGWSSARLAEELNISPASVHKWEKGLSFPRPDKWLELRMLIGISPQKYKNGHRIDLATMTHKNFKRFKQILEEESTKQPTIPSPMTTDSQANFSAIEGRGNVTTSFQERTTIKIPLISWVQAGDWQYAADPMPPGVADEWTETSATRSEHAYALTVHGDSMEPEFASGDIITVDPERQAENGSYVVVKNGAEATFKQYVIDGPSVFLKPLNNRYPIKDMTGVEFRIVGVVVEKRKRY
jgi:SOS-response transcriptional repressor LexA